MLNSLDVHEINLLRRYMTQLHTFGTMLTSLRNQKGLTGVKLAKMSGISPVAMHYAEFGRKLLSEKTIRRLAVALCTPAFPLIQAAAQERGRVSIELDGQPESVKRILYVLASRNRATERSDHTADRGHVGASGRTRDRRDGPGAGGMTQSGFSRLKKGIAGRQPGY
jgi:transcriptional regulator with XRE-family HTH domain